MHHVELVVPEIFDLLHKDVTPAEVPVLEMFDALPDVPGEVVLLQSS